jgi:acyl carrier protein
MVNEQLDKEISRFLDTFFASVLSELMAPYAEDSLLVEDLGLDSLDFATLLAGIEARWDISISDDDVAVHRFSSIAALRAYIRSAVDAPNAGEV